MLPAELPGQSDNYFGVCVTDKSLANNKTVAALEVKFLDHIYMSDPQNVRHPERKAWFPECKAFLFSCFEIRPDDDPNKQEESQPAISESYMDWIDEFVREDLRIEREYEQGEGRVVAIDLCEDAWETFYGLIQEYLTEATKPTLGLRDHTFLRLRREIATTFLEFCVRVNGTIHNTSIHGCDAVYVAFLASQTGALSAEEISYIREKEDVPASVSNFLPCFYSTA